MLLTGEHAKPRLNLIRGCAREIRISYVVFIFIYINIYK